MTYVYMKYELSYLLPYILMYSYSQTFKNTFSYTLSHLSVGESSAGRPPFGTAPVDRGPTTLKEDDFNTSQVETFSDTTHSCLNPKPVTTIVGVFVQCFSLLVKQRNIDVLYEFISMIESWRGLRWLLLSFVRQ